MGAAAAGGLAAHRLPAQYHRRRPICTPLPAPAARLGRPAAGPAGLQLVWTTVEEVQNRCVLQQQLLGASAAQSPPNWAIQLALNAPVMVVMDPHLCAVAFGMMDLRLPLLACPPLSSLEGWFGGDSIPGKGTSVGKPFLQQYWHK